MAFDPPPNHPRVPMSPLYSALADDPDMAELIEFFTSELARRIAVLEQAWTDRDVETLRRFSHQLKGAATGYGYPSITEEAASYERALLAVDDADDLGRLERQHRRFVVLLDRARLGGIPPQQRDAA